MKIIEKKLKIAEFNHKIQNKENKSAKLKHIPLNYKISYHMNKFTATCNICLLQVQVQM